MTTLTIGSMLDGTLKLTGNLDEVRVLIGNVADLTLPQGEAFPNTVASIENETDQGWVDITASKGAISIDKRFTVTRSRKGEPGEPGAGGGSGTDGPRGNVNVSRQISGSSWSDTEAELALSTRGYGAPIMLDVVTLYNSAAGYSETRFYDGADWIVLTEYLNGNMLINGTLGAQKIVAHSITADQLITTAALITASAQLGNAVVDTLKIDGEAITVPRFYSAANQNFISTSPVTLIGASFDPQGGGFMGSLVFSVENAAGEVDSYGEVYLYFDGVLRQTQKFGVQVDGGSGIYSMTVTVPFAGNGYSSSVYVSALAKAVPHPRGSTNDIKITNISMSVMSGKR